MHPIRIGFVLCLTWASALWAAPPSEEVPGGFIVSLKQVTTTETLLEEYGIQPKFVYRHAMNGFAAELTPMLHAKLSQDRRVDWIESERKVHADEIQASPEWGLDRVDQRSKSLDQRYEYSATGAGVTAYVFDTGIRYTHSEFGGRARLGKDIYMGDGSDCFGHGTHVAGIIGGATYGVAKGVSLVSVRVLDCEGAGTNAAVIAGIDWVLEHKTLPAVANFSLGSKANRALDQAVKKLIDAGIPTVVSAGNDGADACSRTPGRVAAAMTIGATDSTDTRAGFSNFGKCVDWFAPGTDIVSAQNRSDSDTARLSGTSMSAPFTTGVAALYLERHPAAKPTTLRQDLFSFTTKGVVQGAQSANSHLLYSREEPTLLNRQLQ